MKLRLAEVQQRRFGLLFSFFACGSSILDGCTLSFIP